MPQPLSTFKKTSSVMWTGDALVTNPDLAIIISRIFATSSAIDLELGLLLVRVLGADEAVALAIYSILETQKLQRRALVAGARAAMDSDDDFRIFSAVISAVDAANANATV